ncbi:hypothetical protein KY289_032500 [Solanum tuberosum]|nr:hypothetical protein KY289_032500 [Solanum tuberosum]
MEFVGGDMFQKIPNANAILLKNDEDCVKILKKCKESIPSRDEGGKLIIIDVVLEDPKNNTDCVRATVPVPPPTSTNDVNPSKMCLHSVISILTINPDSLAITSLKISPNFGSFEK